MRTRWSGIGGLAVVMAASGACGVASQSSPATGEPISVAQFDAWMEEYSNWGRWGENDEHGAANLMTDAKRLEAAALIQTGRTVSLARDFNTEEAADVPEPFQLQMQISPGATELRRSDRCLLPWCRLLAPRRALSRVLQGPNLQWDRFP